MSLLHHMIGSNSHFSHVVKICRYEFGFDFDGSLHNSSLDTFTDSNHAAYLSFAMSSHTATFLDTVLTLNYAGYHRFAFRHFNFLGIIDFIHSNIYFIRVNVGFIHFNCDLIHLNAGFVRFICGSTRLSVGFARFDCELTRLNAGFARFDYGLTRLSAGFTRAANCGFTR